MRCVLFCCAERAALSVICFANASSPKGRAKKPVRAFYSYAQSKLVSPSGRDVAQRQRGRAPSLRELDCRLAARLREQPIICHASGELLRKLVRVLLLPSRLAPRHLPQGGRLWFSAQSNLSLPLGEMSRSDREGRLLLSVLPLHRDLAQLSVLPLHRWRGPPPLSGAADFGSPERGAVTE